VLLGHNGYWVVPPPKIAGLPDTFSGLLRFFAAFGIVLGGLLALGNTLTAEQNLDLALAPVPGSHRSLVGGILAPISQSVVLVLFGALLCVLEVDVRLDLCGLDACRVLRPGLVHVQSAVAKHARLMMTTTGRAALYTWLGVMTACTLAGEHARPTTISNDMGQAIACVVAMYVCVIGLALFLNAAPQKQRLESCRAALFRRHGGMPISSWRKLYMSCASTPHVGLSLREFAALLRSAGLSGLPAAQAQDLAYLGLLLSTPTRPPDDPEDRAAAWSGMLSERSHYSMPEDAELGLVPRVHLRDIVAWVHGRIPVY
jgi:hypothetical protein